MEMVMVMEMRMVMGAPEGGGAAMEIEMVTAQPESQHTQDTKHHTANTGHQAYTGHQAHTTHATKHNTAYTGHQTSTPWHGNRFCSDLVASCCEQVLLLLAPALRPAAIGMADSTPSILETLEPRLQVPQDPALIGNARRKLLQDLKDLKMEEAIQKASAGDEGAYAEALKAMGALAKKEEQWESLTIKEEVSEEDLQASQELGLAHLQWQCLQEGKGGKEDAQAATSRPASQPELVSTDPAQDGPAPSRFPCRLHTGHVIDIRLE